MGHVWEPTLLRELFFETAHYNKWEAHLGTEGYDLANISSWQYYSITSMLLSGSHLG